MSRIWRQLKLEALWVYRNYILLTFPVLFGVWILNELTRMPDNVSHDLYMYALDFHKVQQTLSLGMAMLLGILTLRKDLKRLSYEWLGTMPVSEHIYVVAKFLVGWLYLSLFTLAMLVVYVPLAYRHDVPAPVIWQHAGEFAIQYELSYAVTLALGMLLAQAIPNRVAYLIGFCAWMFGTYFMDIFLLQREQLMALKTFHLNQFFLDSVQESELWWSGLANLERLWSRAFVGAFTVGMLLVIMLLLSMNKPSSRRVPFWVASITVVLLCVGLYTPYALLWHDRFEQAANRKLGSAKVETEGSYTTFPVERYKIQLTHEGQGEISVDATLSVLTEELPADRPVTFQLHRDLKLESVKWNGAELEAKREYDFIQISYEQVETERVEQQIQFTYGGKLKEWLMLQREQVPVFVQADQLYLPDYAAWYPIPGDLPLFYYNPIADKLKMRHELPPVKPVKMDVQVRGFTNRIYGSLPSMDEQDELVFYSDAAQGLTLFASPRILELKVPGEPFTLLTSPSNRHEAEAFLSDVNQARAYFKTWLGEGVERLEQIAYFPLNMVDVELDRWQEVKGNTYFIAETKNHNLDSFQRVNAISAILFQDLYDGYYYADQVHGNGSIVGEIRDLFAELYITEVLQRRSHPIHDLKRSESSVYDVMQKQVHEAIDAGKLDQVKAVLRYFYEEGLTIDARTPKIPMITWEQWNEVWEREVRLE